MTNKSEIFAKMAQESNKDCVQTANEYLVALVKAGVEFPSAETRVLAHFKGVSQEELTEAYDA